MLNSLIKIMLYLLVYRCSFDICLNKDVENHGNGEIGLKTVKVLDAVYRSMKNEKMEKI